MNWYSLMEVLLLEQLSWLKLNPDLKVNLYIWSNVKLLETWLVLCTIPVSTLFSTLQFLCNGRNVVSISLAYFQGKCSGELQSSIPPVLTFTIKICHATPIVANHSLCLQTATLWNWHPREWFTCHYNHNLLKYYLSLLSYLVNECKMFPYKEMANITIINSIKLPPLVQIKSN